MFQQLVSLFVCSPTSTHQYPQSPPYSWLPPSVPPTLHPSHSLLFPSAWRPVSGRPCRVNPLSVPARPFPPLPPAAIRRAGRQAVPHERVACDYNYCSVRFGSGKVSAPPPLSPLCPLLPKAYTYTHKSPNIGAPLQVSSAKVYFFYNEDSAFVI
jgi:hypothetical protein